MHDSTGAKSPVKIFANIFISFVGAGVLGLPFAFKEVSEWVSLHLQLLFKVGLLSLPLVPSGGFHP